MGTRVTGASSTVWFVRESVDEVKSLIDPPDTIYKPRFVDLTHLNASRKPVSLVVAHIIALEPYDA